MKRNPIILQTRQRNTVRFSYINPSPTAAPIHDQSPQAQQPQQHKKNPSFVRFQKLSICSEQEKSQQQSNSQLRQEQKKTLSQNQLAFTHRSQTKNFTEYRSERKSIYARTTEKKITMIPIKMSAAKKQQINQFLSKRIFKTCSKLQDKASIDNTSIKSIHGNYRKIKKQTQSMWSISISKAASIHMNPGPSKILVRERRELQGLEEEFRRDIEMMQQECQKRNILKQLILLIQKQILQVQTNQVQSNSHSYRQNDKHVLNTKTSFNEHNSPSQSLCCSPQKSKNLIELSRMEIEAKSYKLHKIINQFNNQQNLIKSRIKAMKEDIISMRNQRAIFSNFLNKIQHQIKNQQSVYFRLLIQNSTKIMFINSLQLHPLNNQKLITQKNLNTISSHGTYQKFSLTEPSIRPTKEIQLQNQEKNQEDVNILLQKYNSFEFPSSSFYLTENEKLKQFDVSNSKGLIKPRKKVSIHHSKQNTKQTKFKSQIEVIYQIEHFIQKLGLMLDIQKTMNPQTLIQKGKQHSISNEKPIKFIKLTSRQEDSKYQDKNNANIQTLSSSHTQSILMIGMEVKNKKQNLSKQNQQYLNFIQQINSDISYFQQMIHYQNQKKKERILQVQIEIEDQRANDYIKQKTKLQSEHSNLLSQVVALFSQSQLNSIEANNFNLLDTKSFNPILIDENKILRLIQKLDGSYRSQIVKAIEEKDTQIIKKQLFGQRIEQSQKTELFIIKNEFITQTDKENIIKSFYLSGQNHITQTQGQFHPFKYSTRTVSKESKKSNTFSSIEKPKRHQKGLTTLIGNMKIYQSYQKAFTRLDFQHEYRKEMMDGKRKKKTLKKAALYVPAKSPHQH